MHLDDWFALPTPNPELTALILTFLLSYEITTIEHLRKLGARPQSAKLPEVVEKDLMAKMRDGWENRGRVYALSDAGGVHY